MTVQEIDSQISALNDMFEDFIAFNDQISFTDNNQKAYVTSDTILDSVEKANNSAIQYLQELKKLSLNEYVYKTNQDTTILNLCFMLYGQITDENVDKIISANDFLCFNTFGPDPNDPIIKKNTLVTYYK